MTLDKLRAVGELLAHHPFKTAAPRIDAVREILRQHTVNFAAAKQRSNADLDQEIPWDARVLKIVL